MQGADTDTEIEKSLWPTVSASRSCVPVQPRAEAAHNVQRLNHTSEQSAAVLNNLSGVAAMTERQLAPIKARTNTPGLAGMDLQH